MNLVGQFIVFEGIDGSGKTTVLQRMAEQFGFDGIPFLSVRQPSDGKYGQMLRKHLVSGHATIEEELWLFLKDREDHIENAIKPALKAGRTVLCDRYVPSTIAYQGARGLDMDDLMRQNAGFIIPDILFIFDTPVSVAIDRCQRRSNLSIFEHIKFLTKARRNYQEERLMRPLGKLVTWIDGAQTPDAVYKQVCDVLFMQGKSSVAAV